mmetsp:Transcript_43416/g.135060  ORF Transcript_43416/g.135060 Transcript_43416/m.135060 type:complete len:243 (-) Transcript_43416:100-828(-)
MAHIDGAVIVVPGELKERILREGYRCSRRRRVPCSRDRGAALRAFQRFQPGKVHAFLEIVSLPAGVTAEDFKDGIKINTSHLPASCIRADSSSGARGRGGAFAPALAFAPQPSPFAPPAVAVGPSPLGGGFDPHPRELHLGDIYFTQDSIADHFRDGRMLAETRSELQRQIKSVHDIPTITVVRYNNKWFCVDNRRLCVYKRVYPASFKVPVVHGVQDGRFFDKLKQPHGGTTVHVRGRGFH